MNLIGNHGTTSSAGRRIKNPEFKPAPLPGKDGALMAFFKSHAAAKQSMCILLSICFVGLALPANAKKLSFDLPSSNKLTDGDTPQSVEDKEKQDQQSSAADNSNLAPVGLHDEEQSQAAGTDGDTTTLKSTVTQTDFKARAKAGSGDKDAVATGKTESVINKKKLSEKLKDKKAPAAPSVGPIALQETDEESQAKVDTVLEAERRQMSELWQCTIDRNQDIQFVMQKLQPNSDGNHAMASTMKMLTLTLCGAMNMAPMMMGGAANPGAMMGMGSGSGLIQGLFQDKAVKGMKKQAVSQEQATILYKIVRDTADKLVASYRDYKKEQVSIDRATSDLKYLQGMVAETRQSQDPPKQIEMEYTLRKAQREIDEKFEQARLYRQQLTDLAGAEAIAKLDTELIAEKSALDNLTPTSGETKDAGKKPDGPFVNPLQPNQVIPQQPAPQATPAASAATDAAIPH